MSTRTREVPTGCLKAGQANLPLVKMEIAGSITGLLHRTKVCQNFVNDHQVPLEAVYIHPLPPKAAVHGFRLVIGGRIVEGRVQERTQARRAYREAVARGHRAALMEEERSDIFTTTVGNIAPGETVSISFELSGPLELLGSTASLRFPMVVPEVYISGQPVGEGDVGDGIAADTTSVPDASRLTPPRLARGAANPVDLRILLTVDPAGLKLEGVESLCHFAKTRKRDDGCFTISLLPGVERMDRDFVVSLKLKEASLQTTLISNPRTGAFALTIVPPVSDNAITLPRDLVIVLDRSGSMEGFCITAARRAAARMVESLTPADRFAIVAFNDGSEMLDHHLVPANARNQQRAEEFLTRIEALGGTEPAMPLQLARRMIQRAAENDRTETARERTILFITDGAVGEDIELITRSWAGVRINTVGIGANTRAGILESIARVSGGLCSMIPDATSLEEQLRTLHQRLGRPFWTGLWLGGSTDSAPRHWDVWEGVPCTFFGKANELGPEVTLEGWCSSGQLREKVAVCRRDDLAIHHSWARARLLDLDDLWSIGQVEQHVLVALSVEAQVLCRFTAFAAIDVAEVVENAKDMKTVLQPVEPTLAAPSALKQERAEEAADMFGDGDPFGKGDEFAADFCGDPCGAAPKADAGAFFEVALEADSGGFFSDASSVPPSRPALSRSEKSRLGGEQRRGLLARSTPPGASGGKPSLGKKSTEPPQRPQLPSSAPSSKAPPLSGMPRPSASIPAPPPPRGAAPSARAERPAKDKRELPPGVWRLLLELLDKLKASPQNQKAALVEQMIGALEEHCRTLPVDHKEVRLGKTVMSFLVDLRQAINEGWDETLPFEDLRGALESIRS